MNIEQLKRTAIDLYGRRLTVSENPHLNEKFNSVMNILEKKLSKEQYQEFLFEL